MREWVLRVTAGVLILGVCLLTLWYGLPSDVRFELGVQAVSPEGPAGTFTHRPLLYRLVMAALAAPGHPLTSGVGGFEFLLRIEALLLAGAAAGLLFAGLRRWSEVALPVSVAVFGALMLIGPGMTLEPEWVATVLTVAGVGGTLFFDRLRPAVVAGGLLFAAAAAVKVVSLPIALIGILAVFALDRRRAWWSMITAAGSGLLYLGITAWAVPQEITWLWDLRSLQPVPDTFARELFALGIYGLNLLVSWPVIALLPAALVGTSRQTKIIVGLGCLLAVLPVLIQQQNFFYHAAALPVVATAVLAAGLRRASTIEIGGVLVLTLWTVLLVSAPYEWRSDRPVLWLAVTVAAATIAWWWRRRTVGTANGSAADHRGAAQVGSGTRAGTSVARRVLLGSLIACCLLPTSAPTTAGALTLHSGRMSHLARFADTDQRDAQGARVRDLIGADSTVTYLTFGETAYFVGNPASCRYPAPVFLQRSRYQHTQEYTRTWWDTLGCLTDRPGAWLVWDTGWFKIDAMPVEVRRAVRTTFDCEQAQQVGSLRLCPRR